MVLADAERTQLARRLRRARRQRDAHRPAVAQERHRLELQRAAVGVPAGARQVEACPAVRAGQRAAEQHRVGQRRGAARAAVVVGQQGPGDVRDDESRVRPRHRPALQALHARELDPLRVGLRLRAPGRRLDDPLDVDPEEVRRVLLQGGLDRVLHRRLRRPAAAARPAEPQLRDAVLDAEQLDVAAVGLHVRPHAVERVADPLLQADGVQAVGEHQAGDDLVRGEPRDGLLVERREDPLEAFAVEPDELRAELLRVGGSSCRRSARSPISTSRSVCAPPCAPCPCRWWGTCAPRRAGTGRTSGRPA